jgi:hypothetical protein
MADDSVEYAQLLLLLEAELPHQETCDLEWQELAYVKWFDSIESSSDDVLAEYGCTVLTWDMVSYDPATKSAGHRCGLIPLSSIRRREYIVPEFQQGRSQPSGRFHVSVFKY